ncbi:MAG TPA: thiamine phosphate synthase [Pirellulales bacterium]|nr:thiamine phosphate synthase [Pirellulales bacterium]
MQFTPAALRAFKAASHWTSEADFNGIAPPELLLGLLAEAECRAAVMLAAKGIDAEAVLRKWPDLKFSEQPPAERGAAYSAAVEDALMSAISRLADYPQPLVLATEHLLLGLVAANHELSRWLAEQGFAVEPLEAEIHRLAGHLPDLPLPFPTADATASVLPLPSGEGRGEGEAVSVANPSPIAAPPQPNLLPKGEGTCVLRIVDAAANRAREGLRVLEDYARFALDDRDLTEDLKQLRHALAAELLGLNAADLLAARDTSADVGTQLTTSTESSRSDLASVATANFKRVQEALRSLEEYGKTLDPHFGAAMKQLRYRSYTLEKNFSARQPRARRSQVLLANARLYVLIDGRDTLDAFDALARELIAAGVDIIQLRDKRLADRELLERARRLRELTAGTSTLFIMNDRADLAAIAGADGVHVGQDELSVAEARTIVGPGALIGVSTHSLAQAKHAEADGADYIGVGPTFASTTKHFDASQLTGLELLRAVASAVRLPAFAIGGIGPDKGRQVLAAGFSRIAVSGAVVFASDPAAAIGKMRDILGPNRPSR